MKKLAIGVLVVVMLVAVMAMPVLAAPTLKASGGGTVDWPGGRVTYGFEAEQINDSGVDGNAVGEMVIHHRDVFSPNAPGWLVRHIDITYLGVNGNTAWIGGIITKSNDPAEIGLEIVGQVQDNGEGRKATGPDKVSPFGTFMSISDLYSEPDIGMIDWTNGNVQVH